LGANAAIKNGDRRKLSRIQLETRRTRISTEKLVSGFSETGCKILFQNMQIYNANEGLENFHALATLMKREKMWVTATLHQHKNCTLPKLLLQLQTTSASSRS